MLDGDVAEYYSWFVSKRYNLILNKPLRGAHVSFINDSLRDMMLGNSCDEQEAEKIWDEVKKRWDRSIVEIHLNIDVRSDGKHWWLNIPHEERKHLQEIRIELGLGTPHWGLHMSIGYANEKNIDHSNNIVELATKYGANYG